MAYVAFLGVGFKVAGDLSLVRALWKGYTVQHRYTWGIFTLTGGVFLFSQLSLGMDLSKWFFIWILTVNVAIFILTLTKRKVGVDEQGSPEYEPRGEGGKTKYDHIALAVAIASILLWIVVRSAPELALLCTVVADLIGAWMGIKKAWYKPWEEEAWPWAFGTIGSLLALIAVGSTNWMLWIAPLYFFLFDGAMLYCATVRNRKVLGHPC